jgi:hypothetical protein
VADRVQVREIDDDTRVAVPDVHPAGAPRDQEDRQIQAGRARPAVLDQDCWFDGAPVTCRMVPRHAEHIQRADLSYRVISSNDGRLMDGGHRIGKAWLSGRTMIDAVRFTVDPEPDYIEWAAAT